MMGATIVNYLPLLGVGVLFLGEQLKRTDLVALALIMLGLAATHLPGTVAQRNGKRHVADA